MDTRLSAPLRRLRDCDLPERLFYTVFLALMGLGYLMAVTFLVEGHQMADGRPGLSLTDVVYDYYGNRSGTRLEAAIRGPMAAYVTPEETGQIVAWLKSGAGRRHFEGRVAPILARRCLGCHSPASGMGLPDLSTLEAVQALAKVDTGHSVLSLVRVSHIHLFGVGLVLFTVGLVFRMAELPIWLKSTLMLLPFGAVFLDILAWFLTKWDSTFAITVVLAGAVLGLSLGSQILICLYQMWLPRRRPAGPAGAPEGG